MKKVFVMENMNNVDEEIATYLNLQKDWDIKIQGSVDGVNANELVTRFIETDAIAMQSLFLNKNQFTQMLALIETAVQVRETPLEVYVLYGHKNFENFINTKILDTNFKKIIELLEDSQIRLFDIVHEKYQTEGEGSRYFMKYEHRFDTVEMFYNQRRKIIFHKRRPLIQIYDDSYYDKESLYPKPKLKGFIGAFDNLSKKEVEAFTLLMQETYQRELDLKEDLENMDDIFDALEKAELTDLRNSRLAVMDKLGITSYK